MTAPKDRLETPLGKGVRFLEIDILRGMAVVLMIGYHALFDLNFFLGMNFEMNAGVIWMVGRGTAVLFVGLAGLAMTLAWKRKHATQRMPIVKRGMEIFGLGIIITFFTWVFFPDYAIWFGVLHLMGTAMIMGTIFMERQALTTIMGIVITIAGVLLSIPPLQTQLPFWLPLFPVTFPTFDYFPLLPWFGVFLLGMGAGNFWYPSGRRAHRVTIPADNPVVNGLAWMGRKSLAIYLVHQPILVGIIFLATRAFR